MNYYCTTLTHPTKSLTLREAEVMTWTAHGKTRSEISIILSISKETVKNYIENACHKLDAVNKTQAAAMAVALGIISPYRYITGNFTQTSDKYRS